MKKKAKTPKIDPYIDSLMGKLLERLTGIERKLDSLSGQLRSSGNGGPRPYQVPQAVPPRRERMLYEAVCADCSKVCEVPFKPSEERAVYCKECWARRKSGGRVEKRPGMPILTPVAIPPKPASKLSAAALSASAASRPSGGTKKTKPAKKLKKKKK